MTSRRERQLEAVDAAFRVSQYNKFHQPPIVCHEDNGMDYIATSELLGCCLFWG